MAKIWKIAPGRNAMIWEMCRQTHCIALGWRQLNDYRKYKNVKQIVKVLGGGPGDGVGAARSILKFTNEIEQGDIVIANDGRSRIVGIGTVESDYIPPNDPMNPSNDEWMRNVRLVDWVIKQSVDFSTPIFNIPTVHAVSAQKVGAIRQAYLKKNPSLQKKLDGLFRDVEFGANGADATTKEVIKSIEKSLVEKGAFNPANLKDARNRVLTPIVQRRGQPAFRRKLLKAYAGKCAISGCNVREVLEAAHIIPYLGGKTDFTANGMLLRADLHTLFDLRLISVDAATKKVLVSPNLAGTVYHKLAGKKIRLPKQVSCQPHPKALAEHQKKCGLS
jgi:hypothetical protein